MEEGAWLKHVYAGERGGLDRNKCWMCVDKKEGDGVLFCFLMYESSGSSAVLSIK